MDYTKDNRVGAMQGHTHTTCDENHTNHDRHGRGVVHQEYKIELTMRCDMTETESSIRKF